MQEFLKSEGVMTSKIDQCMYGLLTRGSSHDELLPALKPTRFASNSWFILEELTKRCDKSHSHQTLMGGRAAKAAEYPDGLCDATHGAASGPPLAAEPREADRVIDRGRAARGAALALQLPAGGGRPRPREPAARTRPLRTLARS